MTDSDNTSEISEAVPETLEEVVVTGEADETLETVAVEAPPAPRMGRRGPRPLVPFNVDGEAPHVTRSRQMVDAVEETDPVIVDPVIIDMEPNQA